MKYKVSWLDRQPELTGWVPEGTPHNSKIVNELFETKKDAKAYRKTLTQPAVIYKLIEGIWIPISG